MTKDILSSFEQAKERSLLAAKGAFVGALLGGLVSDKGASLGAAYGALVGVTIARKKSSLQKHRDNYFKSGDTEVSPEIEN